MNGEVWAGLVADQRIDRERMDALVAAHARALIDGNDFLAHGLLARCGELAATIKVRSRAMAADPAEAEARLDALCGPDG
jgi:hypothetical protein